MIKKVNVYASMPITILKFPITGNVFGINLDVEDICKCICSKAKVDEILEDGSVVRLDLSNYNKDNNKKNNISSKKAEKVEDKPVVEEIKEEKEPEIVDVKVEEESEPVEVIKEEEKQDKKRKKK